MRRRALVKRRPSVGWLISVVVTTMIGLSACGGSSDTTLLGSSREPAPKVDIVELPSVAPDRPAEPFDFVADEGEVLLVYFGYTSCPDVCPTTLADVAAARSLIGDAGERVDLAMATIDPSRDTEEVLSAYVGGFVPGATALRTEDDAALQAAADLFGVFYDVTTTDDGDIEVLHSGTLFGVDDTGTLVVSWPFGTTTADLAHDLEILVKDA